MDAIEIIKRKKKITKDELSKLTNKMVIILRIELRDHPNIIEVVERKRNRDTNEYYDEEYYCWVDNKVDVGSLTDEDFLSYLNETEYKGIDAIREENGLYDLDGRKLSNVYKQYIDLGLIEVKKFKSKSLYRLKEV